MENSTLNSIGFSINFRALFFFVFLLFFLFLHQSCQFTQRCTLQHCTKWLLRLYVHLMQLMANHVYALMSAHFLLTHDCIWNVEKKGDCCDEHVEVWCVQKYTFCTVRKHKNMELFVAICFFFCLVLALWFVCFA